MSAPAEQDSVEPARPNLSAAEKEYQVRIRILTLIGTALAVAGLSAGQAKSQQAIPRLPNGKPDLSGIWDKPRVQDVSKSSAGQCGSLTMGCKQEGPGQLPF